MQHSVQASNLQTTRKTHNKITGNKSKENEPTQTKVIWGKGWKRSFMLQKPKPMKKSPPSKHLAPPAIPTKVQHQKTHKEAWIHTPHYVISHQHHKKYQHPTIPTQQKKNQRKHPRKRKSHENECPTATQQQQKTPRHRDAPPTTA
eukprot:7280005-Ditylum_brightwellii.AAC.1